LYFKYKCTGITETHKSSSTTYYKERSERGYTVKNDIYGEPVIIKGNNIIARVYSPILTEEERNRRMEQIKQAAIRLLLSKETKGKE
jgi:hypothetical protein